MRIVDYIVNANKCVADTEKENIGVKQEKTAMEIHITFQFCE